MFSFGIDLTLVLVLRWFARQKTEDGQDPSAKWGADLLVADTEDPDDEDNMPIPDVGSVPASGKTRSSIQDWSNDDDDCTILEVYDPCPLAFSYPLPSTSADSGGQVHDVPPLATGPKGPPRKRTAARSAGVGPSAESGPAKKKQRKKVVRKKPRTRPTTVA